MTTRKQIAPDTWVLVAENITGGKIYRKNTSPNVYVVTSRATGAASPTDPTEGVPCFGDSNVLILDETDAGIDVYIRAVGFDGTVEVDV